MNIITLKTKYMIIIYLIWHKFFNFILMPTSKWYDDLINLIIVCSSLYILKYVIAELKRRDCITSCVYALSLMFLFSVVWAKLQSDQSIFSSLVGVASVFPLCAFFFFYKYQVTKNEIEKTIIILGISYTVCYFIGLLTFPNNIFGKIPIEDTSSIESSRGVIRLGVPGADFIVFLIFIILTKYRRSKKYYFFFVPLTIMLLLRGTRTPILVTLVIALFYYLSSLKNKIMAIILAIIASIIVDIGYVQLSRTTSTGVVARYVQYTNGQVVDEDVENNIRYLMAEYYLTEFNTTPQQIIFGNGVPRSGEYADQIRYMSETYHFWIVDIGFVCIYVYFGLLGITLYLLLLYFVIRTKVPSEYMWGKMFVIYCYLIIPTNSLIVVNAPELFAIGLYITYLGSQKLKNNRYQIENL